MYRKAVILGDYVSCSIECVGVTVLVEQSIVRGVRSARGLLSAATAAEKVAQPPARPSCRSPTFTTGLPELTVFISSKTSTTTTAINKSYDSHNAFRILTIYRFESWDSKGRRSASPFPPNRGKCCVNGAVS